MGNDTFVEQDYAPGWKPENVGDKASGKVVDINATDGGYGPYGVLTLRGEDGSEIAVHAYDTVLRGELAKRSPKIGDEFEITYLGRKNEGGKGGKGYKMYRVRGGSATGGSGYDWSQDLRPEDRAQQEVDVPIIPANQVPPPPPQAATDPDPDDTDLPF